MSYILKCDCCGKPIAGTPYGSFLIHDFDDGYNTETYDIALDICGECIKHKFDKQEIANGRTGF